MRRFSTSALGRVPQACTEAILGQEATRENVLLYLQALAALPIENFILYWCGHGNNAGIQLFDGILTYEEIRRALNRIRSRVKILVMNTCRAGAARAVFGGWKTEIGGMDEAMGVLRLASCPGARLLAAVSDTESAHEDYAIGGSRYTYALLHTLIYSAGDLVMDGVPMISDVQAHEGVTDFLTTLWPDEPLPELYGPSGDCAPFPLAVSQVGFPVGEATIERCEPAPGPSLALVLHIYGRQRLRTFVRWQVRDALGRVVADRHGHIDPASMAASFTRELRFDGARIHRDPLLRVLASAGQGIELTLGGPDLRRP